MTGFELKVRLGELEEFECSENMQRVILLEELVDTVHLITAQKPWIPKESS